MPKDLAKGELGLDGVPSIAVDPKDSLRVHVAWSSNWGSWTLRDAVREGKEYYWDIVMRPYVATSGDGGDTFSAPVNVAEGLRVSPEVEGVKTPPDVFVGRSGEAHVVFGERTGAAPVSNLKGMPLRRGSSSPPRVTVGERTRGGESTPSRSRSTGARPSCGRRGAPST